MRRSRLAAGRAGHVRKRGQPHGRQRNVGSPRGPHLMVSTPMVYGYAIGVFNSEDISAGCSGETPPSRPRIPCVYGLEIGSRRRTWLTGIRVPFALSRFARKTRHLGMGGKLNRCVAPSRVHFQSVSPAEITLGVLAPFFPRATLFLAVSGRGGIPHWRLIGRCQRDAVARARCLRPSR